MTDVNPLLHQVNRLKVRTTGNTPMAIKIIYSLYFPMATHSFPVPSNLISLNQWFSAWKMLNEATTSTLHINMLPGLCWWGTIGKYQNGKPKVARKAYIREGWNPVCCHGNKTVMLILWRTTANFIIIALYALSLGAHGPLYLDNSSKLVWGGWSKW